MNRSREVRLAGETWDKDLLPDQVSAAAHLGTHARLLAGPGTGKTLTLTRRVLHLVTARGIDPKTIVALTFTRAAAYELRERVHNALAGIVADMPLVTTLHSYALRNLLHNSKCLETLPQPLRIADDWEERNIVQEDLKGILGCNVADVRDKLNDLSADWDTLAGWAIRRPTC